MTYIAWPAEVNKIVMATNYKKTVQSNVIKSSIEAGPVVYRRRASRMPVRHTIRLRLDRVTPIGAGAGTATELDIFESFVINTLYSGTLGTYFPVPPYAEESAGVKVRFITDNEPYTIADYVGNYAYVQFTLEEILV